MNPPRPPSTATGPASTDTPVFRLDPRLEADSLPMVELGLSSLRLVNESRYPWMILVPRVPEVQEILDLSIPDQLRLWDEIRLCAHVLREETGAPRLNVAQLGNQVPQLHVHLVARSPDDAAWPGPVWGAHPREPYAPSEAAALVARLTRAVRG